MALRHVLASMITVLALAQAGVGCGPVGRFERGDESPGRQRTAAVYVAMLRRCLAEGSVYGGREPLRGLYLNTAAVARTGGFTGPFHPGIQPIPPAVRGAVARGVDSAAVAWVTSEGDVPFPLGYDAPACNRRSPTDAVVLRLTPVPAHGDVVDVGLSGWGSCGVASGGAYRVEMTDDGWRVVDSQLDWVT